jgi:DNA polymerase-3 subunit gamma/tau
MSYRVLARTYRSNTFDEIVGQDAIATTLKNAIASSRVHHGYLFTGTRGVGKTSMARILAKSLNCLSFGKPTVEPCCRCESCLAVAEGEDVDVVEIDAASNTGVDNIRELRANATLRPARSRFKVYIIDEVHMLSAGAFNALLKTLEEPPGHIKFILATTELQKVPATIQSRCQRFDFRAIDVPSIAAHLGRILKQEEIEVEEGVLRRIARLANGSMRDALSLLDMLLSYEAKKLTTAVVDEVLPAPHDELAYAVIDAVANGDTAGALGALDDALQTGRTVERFCEHLVEHVRTLMLLRLCGKKSELVEVPESLRDTLDAQAGKFDAPTYVYMISLLEELRRNVKFSGAARALADASIVRLAMSHQFSDLGELIARLEDEGGRTGTTIKAVGSKKKEVAEAVVAADRVSAPQPAAGARAPATVPKGAVASRIAEAPAAEVNRPAISSAQWQCASRDPLVQKVRQAVDGTLFDVRPIGPIEPPAEVSGNEEISEGNEALPLREL